MAIDTQAELERMRERIDDEIEKRVGEGEALVLPLPSFSVLYELLQRHERGVVPMWNKMGFVHERDVSRQVRTAKIPPWSAGLFNHSLHGQVPILETEPRHIKGELWLNAIDLLSKIIAHADARTARELSVGMLPTWLDDPHFARLLDATARYLTAAGVRKPR